MKITTLQKTRVLPRTLRIWRAGKSSAELTQYLKMIDNRFNSLAYWDNPKGDLYSVELEIISVDMSIKGQNGVFPVIEILQTAILDKKIGERIDGIVGNNFSSYVRDYDFSVLLLEHNKKYHPIQYSEEFW